MKNRILCMSLCGVLATASTAQDTIHVPADYPTIGAAVAAAANGDTVLVAPGLYSESNILFSGKIIALRSSGGPGVTTIDANYANRIVRFTGGETPDTLLEGFTLLRGQAPTGGGTIGDGGGAILLANGSPTIRNCIIRDSRADNGSSGSSSTGYRGGHAGALFIVTGSPLIENCRFQDNAAGTGGQGGTGSTGGAGNPFSRPDPGGTGHTGGAGGEGGAVFVQGGSPVFLNCVFRDNRAGAGGRGGTGGTGGAAGGWIGSGANGGRGGAGGRGGHGGALYCTVGTPTLINCSVVNQLVAFGGSGGTGGAGGFSSLGSGSQGPGGSSGSASVWSAVYTITAQVRNSIIWGNPNMPIPVNNTVSYSCVQGSLYNGAGNINTNPLLFNLDLQAGSPCIDAGDNTHVPAGFTLDMNGEPRFVDERMTADVGVGPGAVVDMGADEFATNYIFPYGCGNPAGSLTHTLGDPVVGGAVTLTMYRDDLPRMNGDFGPMPQAVRAGLIVGTSAFDVGCGMEFRGGFLHVDLSQGAQFVWSDQPFTGSPVDVTVDIPADPMLIGTSLYAQGVFMRLKGQGGGSMRLTESFELVVGP